MQMIFIKRSSHKLGLFLQQFYSFYSPTVIDPVEMRPASIDRNKYNNSFIIIFFLDEVDDDHNCRLAAPDLSSRQNLE